MNLFKKHLVIPFIAIVLLVSACGEMKEEIVIEKDGSGTYEMSFDMIPMMRGMMTGFAAMAAEEGEEMDSTEIAAKVEEMIWKDFQGEVDTVMDITNRLPPEVTEDPQKMAIASNMEVFMKGGKAQGYLLSGIKYDFDDAKGLEDFYELYQNEGGKTDPKMQMLMGNSESEIRITSNSFYRSYQSTGKSEEIDLNQFNKMFEGVSVTTVFRAPKKIKDVKVKNFEIVSRDGNRVTLKYNLMDAMSSGEPVEMEIRW